MITNNVNNQEFQVLTEVIRRRLPGGYLFGILFSYAINALLIIFFLTPTLTKVTEYALWLAVPGAVVVQYFRFLIVFTDQLFADGKSSKMLVQAVALAMTVWGVTEAWHLIAAFQDLTSSEFWGVFGFAISIIVAGYILEISYVNKTNQLTSKQLRHKPSSNGLGKANGQPIPLPSLNHHQ